MQLIDGKKISSVIKEEIALEVEKIKSKGGKTPHLAAVLVGHDGGSETYVAHKVKACEQVGFESTLVRYEDDVTEEELLAKVDELNNNSAIDGFIVQLPLPKHISEQKIIEAIDPSKDVDGFHPENVGRMSIGLPCFVSATPAGIMELLKRYKIETSGRHCVVIGRSNIVGRPVSVLLSQKSEVGNATVTVVHSRTKNLKEICLQADIIIAALGSPEFLKAEMVREGAVVIDVGTTRVKSDKTKSGWETQRRCRF
jgi:methylenetetrahydrofolate dehydrogenase (NADP+)/methenyltetrahydrofolate cyclohydrolase